MAVLGEHGGACAEEPEEWARLEERHRQAHGPLESAAVVGLAEQGFCGACSVWLSCAERAERTRHTGLAAGAPYDAGRRQPRFWVRALTRA
ncbi:hypothetical protein [Nocardioides stalactiti]|uniref:hypothetical protein n=1 Tax=Nocardioides stalactiti TaxID=2755356 RepID=UPI0016004B5F|nr:hypothetical protein [Nocardioides stalactiti]